MKIVFIAARGKMRIVYIAAPARQIKRDVLSLSSKYLPSSRRFSGITGTHVHQNARSVASKKPSKKSSDEETFIEDVIDEYERGGITTYEYAKKLTRKFLPSYRPWRVIICILTSTYVHVHLDIEIHIISFCNACMHSFKRCSHVHFFNNNDSFLGFPYHFLFCRGPQ